MARIGAGAYAPATRYAIQYYAEASRGDLPEIECIELPDQDLAEVTAQAARCVEAGAPYAWAQAYEIVDYDSTADDPAVASWRRADT